MHEAKGDVQMEIQMTPLQLSLSGALLKNSETDSGHVMITTNGSGSSRGNSGSGGEESSDDKHLAQAPLQNRFLETNHNSLLRTSSPIPGSLNNGSGVRKDVVHIEDQVSHNMDEDDDDDDDAAIVARDGGISNSFTSGENSDAEMGGQDGDESNESDMRHDDSRKVFECDVCNMKFSNGANMRRHRMRHSGIKPYECKICKKRFFRKDHLAEHMATHSKLLPFRCPICNKGFQRQIAMRAHFQNEHVGGSQDMVKACPLCTYKAGSMKSLRVHFYSRHGIDLDNPMPHSPLPTTANANGSSVAPNGNGEYSELAHALGFEDREKSSDSLIPSHFLVPQIEISSNASFLSQFSFNADSYYNLAHEDKQNGNGGGPSPNVSPQSDRSSNVASSSEVIIKKEILDDQQLSSPEQQPLRIVEDPTELLLNTGKAQECPGDVQDSPEDLSSGNSSCYAVGKSNMRRSRTLNDGKVKWKHFLAKRSSHNSNSHNSAKANSYSIVKLSPLKSLLREDSSSSACGQDKSHHNILGTSHNDAIAHNIMNTNNSTNASLANGARVISNTTLNGILKSNSGHTSNSLQSKPYEEGSSSAAINSGNNSNGNGIAEGTPPGAHTTPHSRPSRRGGSSSIPNPVHQCVYCGIIFPDKTLYFLHKGCHSDSNPWRCNICGEFTGNVYDFNSHLLSKSHQ